MSGNFTRARNGRGYFHANEIAFFSSLPTRAGNNARSNSFSTESRVEIALINGAKKPRFQKLSWRTGEKKTIREQILKQLIINYFLWPLCFLVFLSRIGKLSDYYLSIIKSKKGSFPSLLWRGIQRLTFTTDTGVETTNYIPKYFLCLAIYFEIFTIQFSLSLIPHRKDICLL